MDVELSEYRRFMLEMEQKAQEQYDKAVLSLSGGAFGISVVFVKDIVGPGPIAGQSWLVISWTSWALSIALVLTSLYLSQQAIRRVIHQIDSETIYDEPPGGRAAILTEALNVIGGLFFLFGVAIFVLFINYNL